MKLIAIVLVGLGTSVVAHADSETERYKKAFLDDVAAMNKQCGTKIAFDYDLASEIPNSNHHAGSGYSNCRDVARSITTACRDDKDAKAMIAESVKTVSCKFSEGSWVREADRLKKAGINLNPTEEVERKGKRLIVTFDWNTFNMGEGTSRFIRKKLTAATGYSVDEQRDLDKYKKAFLDDVAAMNKQCGTKIAVDYDFASEVANANHHPGSGYSSCDDVVRSLIGSCRDDKDIQARIAASVHAVSCRFSEGSWKREAERLSKVGSGQNPTEEVERKGSALIVTFDWDTFNMGEGTRRLLYKEAKGAPGARH